MRKFNFFGQTAAEPFNDNLALAANTIEFLGGSQDLISIRGKGTSLRPFDVVRKMEAAAQKQYQAKLSELDARLQQVQTKLSELPHFSFGKYKSSQYTVMGSELFKYFS